MIPQPKLSPRGGKNNPAVRNAVKGPILMRQEAEKGGKCAWVRGKMASVAAHQASFHHTWKELAHFILPTSENVKGGEEEEEEEADAVLFFTHR